MMRKPYFRSRLPGVRGEGVGVMGEELGGLGAGGSRGYKRSAEHHLFDRALLGIGEEGKEGRSDRGWERV